MANSVIFEGDIQVHLYGQNALIPICLDHQLLKSVVGVEDSELIINDHRTETIQAVKNSSPDGYPIGFLKAFNHPAQAEIRYDTEKHGLEIDLYECSATLDLPILWMGILENNIMPRYEVEWEVLKPVDENNTAFCALVKTQSVMTSNQLSLASTSDEEVWFSQ